VPRSRNSHVASRKGRVAWPGARRTDAGWTDTCRSVPVDDGGRHSDQHTDEEKPREHPRSSTRMPRAASAPLISLPRVFLMRRHVGISERAVVFLTNGTAARTSDGQGLGARRSACHQPRVATPRPASCPRSRAAALRVGDPGLEPGTSSLSGDTSCSLKCQYRQCSCGILASIMTHGCARIGGDRRGFGQQKPAAAQTLHAPHAPLDWASSSPSSRPSTHARTCTTV